MLSEETEDVLSRSIHCSLIHQGESKLTNIQRVKCTHVCLLFSGRISYKILMNVKGISCVSIDRGSKDKIIIKGALVLLVVLTFAKIEQNASIVHPNDIMFVIIWTDGAEEKGSSDQSSLQNSCVSPSKQHGNTEDSDSEMVRRAQEEGRVHVVFPGTVTQEGCSRFVSEILKCILYQRQQLPMTYDQLVYSQKKQQATAQVNCKYTAHAQK